MDLSFDNPNPNHSFSAISASSLNVIISVFSWNVHIRLAAHCPLKHADTCPEHVDGSGSGSGFVVVVPDPGTTPGRLGKYWHPDLKSWNKK